jgi:hypothetical protein
LANLGVLANLSPLANGGKQEIEAVHLSLNLFRNFINEFCFFIVNAPMGLPRLPA